MPADVAEYIERDRAELEEVGRMLEPVAGRTLTQEASRDLLFSRMLDLYDRAARARQDKAKKEKQMPDYNREYWDLKRKSTHWLKRYFLSQDDRNRLIELGDLMEKQYEERRERASFTSGQEYFLHETSEIRKNYPARDITLLYRDNGAARGLRLNVIQLGLAQRGIYYKGEPTDNRFSRTNESWDQAAYPVSPLKFYEDHVKKWAEERPEELRELLSKDIE